ncbi:SHIPPO_1-like protein [Hexamita inflata]|uniref:SHIPPO 1-like protein n=1 Tax=Hexamita inflata TaxID=28002 RepID=A0AA86NJT2_9EUKA|nr:SHIPPO 1-like protein [Hexamita inflata]CAI9926094.1 SHIPPO 1-like protein [Hexamita inflata]CAI9976150.1 SHIPPO 1-like protein [Hexamita inflata]
MDLDQTQARQNPSPFQYNIKSAIGTGKSFSLSGRVNTTQYTGIPSRSNIGPEPTSYNVPSSLCKDSPKFSLAGRTKNFQVYNNPAPNAYSISPQRHGTMSSLAGRTNLPSLSPSRHAPSPNAYDIPTMIGTSAKASLAGRTNFQSFYKQADMSSNIAPNAYKVERVPGQGSPKFTLKSRIDSPNKNANPGPGAYDLPNKTGFEPKISFGVKPERRGLILDERKYFKVVE